MNEGEYLEMANQLKESFDEKDKEMIKIKKENELLKKNLLSVYGYVRILDYISTASDEIDFELRGMIDILRGFLSDLYDDFFNINFDS